MANIKRDILLAITADAKQVATGFKPAFDEMHRLEEEVAKLNASLASLGGGSSANAMKQAAAGAQQVSSNIKQAATHSIELRNEADKARLAIQGQADAAEKLVRIKTRYPKGEGDVAETQYFRGARGTGLSRVEGPSSTIVTQDLERAERESAQAGIAWRKQVSADERVIRSQIRRDWEEAIASDKLYNERRASVLGQRKILSNEERALLNGEMNSAKAFSKGLPLQGAGGINIPTGGEPATGIMGNIVKDIGKVAEWTVATGAVFGTIAAVKGAITTYAELEVQENMLIRVGHGLGATHAEQAVGARQVKAEVIDLAVAYGVSADQAMRASIVYARLGFNQQQVVEATKTALTVSNLSGISPEEAAMKMEAIMMQFELPGKELPKIADAMAYVKTQSRATMEDLLQAASRTAAVWKEAGGEYKGLLAAIGVTAQATSRPGAEIGNAFKTILSKLGSKDEQTKLFEQTGIIVADPITGKVKPALDVLTELGHKLKDDEDGTRRLTDAEKQYVEILVGGVRQRNILIGLAKNMGQVYRVMNGEMTAEGLAEKQNAEFIETLTKKWEKFKTLLTTSGAAGAEDSGVISLLKGTLDFINMSIEGYKELFYWIDKLAKYQKDMQGPVKDTSPEAEAHAYAIGDYNTVWAIQKKRKEDKEKNNWEIPPVPQKTAQQMLGDSAEVKAVMEEHQRQVSAGEGALNRLVTKERYDKGGSGFGSFNDRIKEAKADQNDILDAMLNVADGTKSWEAGLKKVRELNKEIRQLEDDQLKHTEQIKLKGEESVIHAQAKLDASLEFSHKKGQGRDPDEGVRQAEEEKLALEKTLAALKQKPETKTRNYEIERLENDLLEQGYRIDVAKIEAKRKQREEHEKMNSAMEKELEKEKMNGVERIARANARLSASLMGGPKLEEGMEAAKIKDVEDKAALAALPTGPLTEEQQADKLRLEKEIRQNIVSIQVASINAETKLNEEHRKKIEHISKELGLLSDEDMLKARILAGEMKRGEVSMNPTSAQFAGMGQESRKLGQMLGMEAPENFLGLGGGRRARGAAAQEIPAPDLQLVQPPAPQVAAAHGGTMTMNIDFGKLENKIEQVATNVVLQLYTMADKYVKTEKSIPPSVTNLARPR